MFMRCSPSASLMPRCTIEKAARGYGHDVSSSCQVSEVAWTARANSVSAGGLTKADMHSVFGIICCCLLCVRRYAESNGMGFEKSNPQK
jgi:hypothetical protein